MTQNPEIRLSQSLDRNAILAALDRVMDPELDESVLSLGFVESVTADDACNITVSLRLPTYWCAANFSFLMASDAHNELCGVEGVRSVTVRLGEHFAGSEVESGTGRGMSFGEAFPKGGPDSLEETRQIFLRKGYFSRQQKLLQALKRSGLSFAEISGLRIEEVASLPVDARLLTRYLERRRDLGLDCSEYQPLIVDIKGESIAPEQMEMYYARARTTRLEMAEQGQAGTTPQISGKYA